MSWEVLNISKKGDTMTSLGNLCECSGLTIAKTVSWCSDGNSCAYFFAHYTLSHYWAPLNTACLCPLGTLTSDIYILTASPWAFFSTDWTVKAFLTFSNNEMLQSPNYLSGFFQCVHVSLVRNSTELEPGLQVWSSQCSIKGKSV